MKTIKLISLFLIAYIDLNAQVTLDQTYSLIGNSTKFYSYSIGCVNENLSTSNVTKYILYDTNHILQLYNLDYSVYKSITITPPSGYAFVGYYLASTNLFNNDNKVEFIITFSQTVNHNVTYSMLLMDESGNTIQNIGNYYYATAFINSNNQFKMLVYNAYFSPVYTNYPTVYHYENYTNIYSLAGTVPKSTVLKSDKINESTPYPNPANTVINLPYQLEPGQTTTMNIYNSAGQLIDEKIIDSHFEIILLNVQSYKPGVYFYKYNDISKSFIVN